MEAEASSTQGMHRAVGTLKGVFKCRDCRTRKIKCKRNGDWEQNGRKNKCENCKNSGRACSAPEKIQKGEVDNNSDHNIDEESAMADTSNVEETKQALRQGLKDLDAVNGVREELDRTLGPHLERQRQIPSDITYSTWPDFEALKHDRMSSTSAFLERLASVERYADKAAQFGETAEAESAYLRIRELYLSSPDSGTISHQKLLRKMAAFYSKIGEPLGAEKYLRECAQICKRSGRVDEEMWTDFARVSPGSSRELDRGLGIIRGGESNVQVGQSAFPAFHRISRSACLYTAPPPIFGMGSTPDITGAPPLHDAITSGNPAAFAMIEKGTVEQLELRDWSSRTPMFLIALYNVTNMGFALMTRYEGFPIGLQQRLVDARDSAGQTILATAILSGCIFEFIEKLIVSCHADVDPDPMYRVLSPLQAAAIRGRTDVVNLLLTHGAQNINYFSDELSASELALYHGHVDLGSLIVARTSSRSGPILGYLAGAV